MDGGSVQVGDVIMAVDSRPVDALSKQEVSLALAHVRALVLPSCPTCACTSWLPHLCDCAHMHLLNTWEPRTVLKQLNPPINAPIS